MAKGGDCFARQVVALMSMCRPSGRLRIVFCRLQRAAQLREPGVSTIMQQVPLLIRIERIAFLSDVEIWGVIRRERDISPLYLSLGDKMIRNILLLGSQMLSLIVSIIGY